MEFYRLTGWWIDWLTDSSREVIHSAPRSGTVSHTRQTQGDFLEQKLQCKSKLYICFNEWF